MIDAPHDWQGPVPILCRCQRVFTSRYRIGSGGVIWTETPCDMCRLNFRILRVNHVPNVKVG